MEMKKVLVISSSFRKNGNSDVLADSFIRGASEVGHDVKKVQLLDKKIEFCKGCLVCQKKMPCVIHDDVQKIIDEMKKSDVIVFATPIYFYEMSGQMKTLIDRTNPLFVDNYQFRDIYLIATSADDDEKAIDNAISGLKGWIECFENSQLKGVIKGVGLDQFGDVYHHEDVIDKAYIMGKNV